MSVVQKEVLSLDSVDTVVKSLIDLAHVLKGEGDWKVLVPDLLSDIAAVPSLLVDVKSNPFEAANSVAIGAVSIAKILLA